jgi:hypothetical protein
MLPRLMAHSLLKHRRVIVIVLLLLGECRGPLDYHVLVLLLLGGLLMRLCRVLLILLHHDFGHRI